MDTNTVMSQCLFSSFHSESQLMQLSLVLSSFDALISLGTLAVEQRLTKPEITEDTALLIKGIL